ncbi:kinase-like domain-containing protein [Mycena maculata]|uniref:non-specific serine/threonine protein kinase n=1 Tax=Mycena maculata TaxID=230809 RepID=A0AAD7K6J2_9AGAR|nr:kinase-like domain-containing protein [Mycena maculata]
MPIAVNPKACSSSTATLSSNSSTVTATPQKILKPGSKHVLFCITNDPVTLPSEAKPPRQTPKALPPPHSLKITSDGAVAVPGPFLFLKTLQVGSYGEAVAVRELTPAWWQGTAPGRVLCMKVFHKVPALARGLVPGIVQEVLAYRNLARAESEGDGAAFVMTLEASLQDANRLFFVMELMDCDLLAVFSSGYRFSRKQNARRWICQIALGIAFIHASGVIHRDIKPENLLLSASGTLRIADFGAAHTERAARPLDPAKGYAAEVTGTYAYMAPEMLANRRPPTRKYGLAVDYWSAGCVAFELLAPARAPLFDSEAALCRYEARARAGHRAAYLACAGLGAEAAALVAGLLHLDPLQRYRTADLRAHAFFQNADGTSAFDAVSRAPDTEPHDAAAELEPGLVRGHRHVMALSLDPPEDENTFKYFGWVNPRGIWGGGA